MAAVLCGRVGCGEPAVAALLMSPQERRAWLVGLDHEFASEGVPLCAHHADRISVPFGWTLQDDRPPPKKKRRRRKPAAEPVAEEPATSEPVAEPVLPGTEVDPEPEPVEEPAATEPEPEPASEVDPVAAEEPAAEEPAAVEVEVEEPAAEVVEVEVEEPAAEVVEVEPGLLVEPESTVDTISMPAIDPTVDPPAVAVDAAAVEEDPDYVPPEYQFREDGVTGPHDDPTLQLPAISIDPPSPSEVPLEADRVAAAIDDEAPRLSVVPPDDDPSKTFDFSDGGQGALWNEPEPADTDPDETTPLLKRAFRVVRDD